MSLYECNYSKRLQSDIWEEQESWRRGIYFPFNMRTYPPTFWPLFPSSLLPIRMELKVYALFVSGVHRCDVVGLLDWRSRYLRFTPQATAPFRIPASDRLTAMLKVCTMRIVNFLKFQSLACAGHLSYNDCWILQPCINFLFLKKYTLPVICLTSDDVPLGPQSSFLKQIPGELGEPVRIMACSTIGVFF